MIDVARLGDGGIAGRIFNLVPDLGDVISSGGRTPLHASAFSGNSDVTKLLLARDVNVNAVRNADFGTPLHLAARQGHLTAITLLLEAGAVIEAGDRDGMTALAWADLAGHEDVAGLLLKRGADPETCGVHRRNELHRAAANGNVATVRVALRGQADPDAQDLWGTPPFISPPAATDSRSFAH